MSQCTYDDIVDRSLFATLHQSYRRTTKRLKTKLRFAHNPKCRKEASTAKRRLKTITGLITREIERDLCTINVLNIIVNWKSGETFINRYYNKAYNLRGEKNI
ncbi:MAG TPA: hypothetical protein PK376_06195 [Bacteroidales bacterium]|nr:hypothetical protein [Bacteroidales bacterium]HPW43386.1 hypothetical protein [Bacteroidales bacterium]